MFGSLLRRYPALRQVLTFVVVGLLLAALLFWLLGRWGGVHILAPYRENQFLFGMLGVAAIYIAMARERMDWMANLLFLLGLALELLLFLPWENSYRVLLIATCNLGILSLLLISTLRGKKR